MSRPRRITRRRYAEQFDWWAASGWTLRVEEEAGGGLSLDTVRVGVRGRVRHSGARAEASDLYDRTQVRLFLAIALYLHLHPRRAAVSYVATGLFCSDKELTAFISQQHRKVARLDEARRLGVE